MRKVEIGIYKFDELSKDVQAKVIEKFRQSNWEDYSYTEVLTDHLQEDLEYRGLEGMRVVWCLSYCQGDGVSFTGKIDSETMKKMINSRVLTGMKENQIELFNRAVDAGWTIATEIYRIDNHYAHEYTVKTDDVYSHSDEYTDIAEDLGVSAELIDDLFETLQEEIEQYRISLCKELEELGYKDIEYYDSEETIKENIIENDYEFYEDGGLV